MSLLGRHLSEKFRDIFISHAFLIYIQDCAEERHKVVFGKLLALIGTGLIISTHMAAKFGSMPRSYESSKL